MDIFATPGFAWFLKETKKFYRSDARFANHESRARDGLFRFKKRKGGLPRSRTGILQGFVSESLACDACEISGTCVSNVCGPP